MKQSLQRKHLKFFCSFSTLLLMHFFSSAQPGILDQSFGNFGEVITSFDSLGNYGRQVAVTADGGSIMAGEVVISSLGSVYYDIGLVKHDKTGKTDSSFGTNGKVATNLPTTSPKIGAMAVQSDGKIVVAVTSQILSSYYVTMLRYLPNGTLDSAFGSNGSTTYNAEATGIPKAMVLQADGKIVVAGTADNSSISNLVVWRYKSNGLYDSSFATNGQSIISLNISGGPMSAVLQPNGKVVIATTISETMGVIRLTTNGLLDDSFKDTKFATSGYVRIVVNQPGYSTAGSSLVLQSDNKIVVGGTITYGATPNLGVARLDTTGAIDETFGNGGIQFTQLANYSDGYTITKQPDDKILLGGYTLNSRTDFVIARYTKDGLLDSSFGTNGYTVTDFAFNDDYAYSVQLQTDGKILLGGYTKPFNAYPDFALARYNNDSFSVLPVDILSFSATQKQKNILVSWKATNSTGNNIFVLEKSLDGTHFAPIYQTKSDGNYASVEQYNHIDASPVYGANYYRIEQKSGSAPSKFSNIIKVVYDDVLPIIVSPNPVVSTLNIKGLPVDIASNIMIADNTGKILAKYHNTTSSTLTVNLASLSPGIYFLYYIDSSKHKTVTKFIKQ